MTEEELYPLKYPIGEFTLPSECSPENIAFWISQIESFPASVSSAVDGLSKEQKEWKYRPKGWNIRQLVHHCADSHINSLVRFKWALTEDNPTIKAYDENGWIDLADVQESDLTNVLLLIQSLHKKWVALLKSLSDAELARTFVHPASGAQINLAQNIANYAWHCEHHLAHIRQAIKHEGSFN